MYVDASEVRELARGLRGASLAIEPEARLVVADGADHAVTVAQTLVEVETGLLQSTIGHDMDSDGLGFAAGPTADYGPYVEYGDSNNGPRPFMVPALDGTVDDVADDLGDVAVRLVR